LTRRGLVGGVANRQCGRAGWRPSDPLKYAVPVKHVGAADGTLRAEPLAVYDITTHREVGDRFAFELRASDLEVVVDLPRMYGPFVYRDSREVLAVR